MASVFRTRSKKTGKLHPVWRFRYRGSTGKWECGTGWPDRKRTLEHALNLEAECRAVRKGEKPPAPSWLKNRNKPILEVIKDFMAAGRTNGGRGGRPWDEMNARLKETYLAWWTEELGLTVLSDINLGRVEKSLQQLLKTHAPKSVSLRVESLRSLCLWAIKRGLIGENPLLGMARLDIRPIEPHRALEEQEVAALLINAPPDRRLWYQVALETGYRVNELRSLKVQDLDPFGPSLPLGGDFTKNRKDARQPITRILADKLAVLAAGRGAGEPLLGIPVSSAYERIRVDYVAAKVKLSTPEGKATWHSLRKVFVNNLVRSGCDLKTVMTLARHSSAAMSMDTYASAQPALLRAAAESAATHIDTAIKKEVCRIEQNRVIAVNEENSINPNAVNALHLVQFQGGLGVEPSGLQLPEGPAVLQTAGNAGYL